MTDTSSDHPFFGNNLQHPQMLQAKTKVQQKRVYEILGMDKDPSDTPIVEVSKEGPITFEQMKEIVTYLTTVSPEKDELFERCWVAYRRKGNKKQALLQWKHLSQKQRNMVLPHIKAYVSSREANYQKDFERYLRDKVFLDVVYGNGAVIYDLNRSMVYQPEISPLIAWDDATKRYYYLGYDLDFIIDGYSEEDRPDGACLTLNNGRGTIAWDKKAKVWNKT